MVSNLLGLRGNALRLPPTWGKCSQTFSNLGEMLPDLLTLRGSALRLAPTWAKCSQTCSDLGKMLSDLLRLGENTLTLAHTWVKCSQTCRDLGKMLSNLLRFGENALRPAPVPLHMKQTINAAELLATLQTLRLHADEPKVAICTDSEYVLKRAQGAALRWQARGWVGSEGPVSNIPLWKEVPQHLDSTFQDILWVKVPSHVNLEGNERADTLANNGRLSNPLYPNHKTPRVHPARQRVKRTCQVAPRRPPHGRCPPRDQPC